MMEQERMEGDKRRAHDFKLMAQTFLGISGVTLLAVPMASYNADGDAWFMTAGLSYAIFLSSGLSGGILGFIFSVPHTNKITTAAKATDQEPESGADKAILVQRQPLLRSNSSLEKISEWLTTMLVGVGLSQINSIFSGLKAFGEFLRPLDTIGATGASVIIGKLQYVGPTVLVAGVCFGFLSAYLFTRLRITHLFVDAEQELNRLVGLDARLSAEESHRIVEIVESTAVKESASGKQMITAQAPSVRDALAVMTQLLYDTQEKGFNQAIDMGNQLLATPAVSSARFWFLMAAAQGQRYSDRKKSNAPVAELDMIRGEVLNAVDKTLELDPRYKSMLRKMLDEGSIDNDLSSFVNDASFLMRLS